MKHMHDLSDEGLCERWVENPYAVLTAAGYHFRLLLLWLALLCAQILPGLIALLSPKPPFRTA